MELKNFKISDTIIIVHDGILKVVIVKGVSISNAFASGILLICQVAYSSQQCVRLFDIAIDYEGNPIDFEFLKVVSNFTWWTDIDLYCSTHYPEYCI
ncbi:hypothetical protein WCWAEYFT_CDS0236 [Vibrio phage VB_VaC_TDDLMA]